MADLDIKAKTEKICEILAGITDNADTANRLYIVPNYQRPYSWDKDNIADLIGDLTSAFIYKSEELYFCGSLVLVGKESEKDRYGIIDGQQRLTTFILLACVVRDLYLENLLPKAEKLINEFIKDSKSNELRFFVDKKFQVIFKNLICNKLDFNKTYKEIENKEYIDSNGIYLRNAYYIKDELEIAKQEYNIKISEFIEWIYDKVILSVITCPSNASAIKVFNILNNRGMPLSQTDIIKSELMDKVSNAELDGFKSKWDGIDKELRHYNYTFDDMLNAYLYHLKAENPKDSFDKELLKTNEFQKEKDGIVIINKIDKFKASYLCVLEAKDKYIYCLKYLPNRIYWVSILASAKHIDYKQYDELKGIIMAYYYQNFIAGFTANKFKQTSFKILALLKNNKDLEEIKKVILENISKNDTTKKFKENVKLNQVYGYKWVKPILLMVEYFHYKQIDDKFEFMEMDSQIHLEHILPQTLPDKDNEKEDYGYWTKLFSDNERDDWKNSLANLTLLRYRKNIKAKNYSFLKKKEIYGKSDGVKSCFEITMDLLKNEKWSVAELEARKKKLVAWIDEIIDIIC